MQVKSAGGKEYEYIAVDDYTRAVYTQPIRVNSEASEAFGVFKGRIPEKDARNHDGQRARTVYGRDEGYLREGNH